MNELDEICETEMLRRLKGLCNTFIKEEAELTKKRDVLSSLFDKRPFIPTRKHIIAGKNKTRLIFSTKNSINSPCLLFFLNPKTR